MTPEPSTIAIIIAAAALAISLVTTWVTLFRRGSLRMTQRTTVMFGPDGRHHEGAPKVYLRALLYSTAKRGHVIENMFVTFSRGEQKQNFPIWVLGNEQLFRGSGLFVGEQGVVADHHFVLPSDADPYPFRAGEYQLEVFARIVGVPQAKLLWSRILIISQNEAKTLTCSNSAIFFDWGPDSNCYIPTVRSRPPMPAMPERLTKLFGQGLPVSPNSESM
jgi:hypothetical protein